MARGGNDSLTTISGRQGISAGTIRQRARDPGQAAAVSERTGPGTFSRCQPVPFHVSANGPVPRLSSIVLEFPTAMQRAALVQDTPFSHLDPVRGFAVVTSRQLVPFYASANVSP